MNNENQILDAFKSSPHLGTVKEPKSGKYLFASDSYSKVLGFESPDQMTGLTVRDLNLTQERWGEKDVIKMDQFVLEKKVTAEHTHPFLTASGSLIYETVTKSPILGSRNNIIGIVSFNHDFTERLSHQSLYHMYKAVCGKKSAVQKLLRHLDIESWFCALPTERELLVLLERAAGKVDKEIAKTHHVSTRTTETHLLNLRAKLKGDALPSIIASLRKQRHGIEVG